MTRRKKKNLGLAVGVAGVLGAGVFLAYRWLTDPDEAGKPLLGLGNIPPQATSYYNNAPQEVRNLPFNALRTNVPFDSGLQVQAVEQQVNPLDVVAVLPKNMGFSRWRQGGGTFGGNIESLLAAISSHDNLIAGMEDTIDRVPRLTVGTAVSGFNQLPIGGERYEEPISRGIPQQPQYVSEQLVEYARTGEISVAESPFMYSQNAGLEWEYPHLMQVPHRRM